MATSKKASKKSAARKRVKKPVRRLPIGKCKDVGNELKHRGTSAADDEVRAHGGVCLVKRRNARKVTTRTFIVRPRAEARRARLARAAKRSAARSASVNGRRSVRNSDSVTFKVYTLDVWGNAKDGYEVNDRSYTGSKVTLSSSGTKADLLRALKDEGLVKKTARVAQMEVDDSNWPYFVSVDAAKTSKPIFQLTSDEE